MVIIILAQKSMSGTVPGWLRFFNINVRDSLTTKIIFQSLRFDQLSDTFFSVHVVSLPSSSVLERL